MIRASVSVKNKKFCRKAVELRPILEPCFDQTAQAKCLGLFPSEPSARRVESRREIFVGQYPQQGKITGLFVSKRSRMKQREIALRIKATIKECIVQRDASDLGIFG